MEFSLRYLGPRLCMSNCVVYIKPEICAQPHVDNFFVSALSFSFDVWHKVKTSRVVLEMKKHFQAHTSYSRSFVNL